MEPTHFTDKGKEAEKIVSEIAENSYLKYWCYRNPYNLNDKGKKDKEICDLLIPFYDTLILISVKNYSSDDKEKYKRKVVEESTRQLFGAQRKIFSSGKIVPIEDIEGKRLDLNPSDYKKIHRITVNMGQQFDDYELIDTVENKGSINILDKETVFKLFQELDTIKDLTDYLNKREKLLLENGYVIECSEKDLLAYYLTNAGEFPTDFSKRTFVQFTSNIKGKWEIYEKHDSVRLKKQANEISYFIDNLIKNDILNSNLYSKEDKESFSKVLMTLDRFQRRQISEILHGIVKKYQNTENDFCRRHYIDENGTLFLFVYYPSNVKAIEIDTFLKTTAEVYAYKFKPKQVLLLGMTQNFKQWKFGLKKNEGVMDNLSKEKINFYENFINTYGWFKNMTKREINTLEYPDENSNDV